MRYFTVILASGCLVLAGCQPPEDDDNKDQDTLPHPPIEESQSGAQLGADRPGGPPEDNKAQAGGGYQSAQQPGSAVSGEDADTYTSEPFPVSGRYPQSLQKVSAEQASGGWHTFVNGDEEGQRLLTLKVPGDTRARFQLGASRTTQALSHCKDVPEQADGGNKQTLTIDGVHFTRFDVTRVDGDSYTTIRSYRATYTESCYAIDLIASGSGGEGQAADQQSRALDTLQTVLDGVAFTE